MDLKENRNMKYSFRDCTIEDFDFLFELKRQNFKWYVDKIWGWREEEQKERLRQDLEKHLSHKKIIKIDNKPIGVYAVHRTADGDLFINEISILKEYQKKGIGRNILENQLEENHQKGIRTILQVFKDNPAKRLYEQLGFKVYGETETHYQMENVKEVIKQINREVNLDNIEIRKCTTKDVQEIYDIQNRIIDHFKEEEKGYFLPFKKESYIRIVNDPVNDGEIYGAFINNKMIAWIFLSVSNRMEELKQKIPNLKGTCADIDGVVVLPEYRGNGLQKILVRYLEERAKEKKIENIVAEVTFENKYSLKNLKELGYEEKTWYQKDKNIKRYILLKKLGGK